MLSFEGRTYLLRETLRSRDVVRRVPASFWFMIHISVYISYTKKYISFWLTLIYFKEQNSRIAQEKTMT